MSESRRVTESQRYWPTDRREHQQEIGGATWMVMFDIAIKAAQNGNAGAQKYLREHHPLTAAQLGLTPPLSDNSPRSKV